MRTMGSNWLSSKVPVLWGQRALVMHPDGKLSIVRFGERRARAEIIKGKPAEGIQFIQSGDALVIKHHGKDLYRFTETSSGFQVDPIELSLPAVYVDDSKLVVGGMVLSNNMIASEVAVTVSEEGIGIGGRLPPELRKYFTKDTR